MATQEEILAKADEVTTGVVGNASGGLLKPEQSNRFIDFVVDQSNLMRNARVIRMRTPQMEIDKLSVGTRLLAKATEATDTGANAPVTFSKVSLSSEKIRLDWEVSTEALEDNIEGAGLEDHLVRTMTRAFANDLEDLAINGTGAGTNTFLNIMAGFHKKERDNGNEALSVTSSGSAWTVQDLQDIVLAMPRKYRGSRSAMKFYAGSPTLSSLLNNLAQTGNFSSERIVERIVDGSVPQIVGAPLQYRVLGLPIVEVPYLPDDYVSLTFPENRIWGFQRDVTVHREFKPKKDTVEYTVFVRFGVQVEETDAVAYGSK